MEILTILVAGVVTWGLRVSFIAAGDERSLPPFIDRFVANARPAVLAALAAMALARGGDGNLLEVPWGWYAGVVAAAVAMMRSKSLAVTVLAGMGTVWVAAAAGSVGWL